MSAPTDEPTIHEWEGGHLWARSDGRFVIGPAFRWEEGDLVRLPDGTVVEVGQFNSPQPMNVWPRLGYRTVPVPGIGKATYLVDGLRDAVAVPS